MTEREGCVKPEFGEWYPSLVAGQWYPAARIRDVVLVQLLSGEPRWQADDRVPADDHFVFRGGVRARGSGFRTRHTDAPSFGDQPPPRREPGSDQR
jgi:hypothetical protein